MEPYSLGGHEGRALPHIGRLLASASQTSGAFEVIEYIGPAAPPPHVHQMREEGFYILDGSFTFTLGDDVVEAGAGSFVFVPRGTPPRSHFRTRWQGSVAHRAVGPGGVL